MAKIRLNDLPTIENLRALLISAGERFATEAAFREKKDGIYQDISFARFLAETEALGVALGDRISARARVLILGDNSYHWVLSFMALVCGAGIPVPVDTSLSPEAVAEIAKRSHAKAVLYDAKHAPLLARLTGVTAICFDELPLLLEDGKMSLLVGAESIFERDIDRRALAAIFFTSGSTGAPKGVMLSHANLCRTVADVGCMASLSTADTFLSILPLSHAYECVLGFLVPLSVGATVAFSEGLAHLGANMREIHPTAMVLLPFLATALYEKCWARILARGAETSVRRAIAISDPVRPLSARQSMKERLLATERAMFGGKLNRLFLIGGHTDAAVQKGLRQLGIFAVQAYGLTECAGLAALNSDDSYKDGCAGKTTVSGMLDIYNAQTDGSGEIRFKGESVMIGYLGTYKKTEGDVKDGWFYTGDMGKLDKDGFLHILGRKQNCIVTAMGHYICPEELEELLCQSPFVAEAAVVGAFDKETKDISAAAIVYPNFEYAKETFGEADWEEFLDGAVEEWVSQINKSLPAHKKLSLYVLREEPFPRGNHGKLFRATLTAELAAMQEEA